MKKFRLLSLALALSLALSIPVRATQAEPVPEEPVQTTAPAESTAPVETTLPVETEPTMPAGFLGDASVEYGSRTLDAKKPLADMDDYTGKVKAAIVYDLTSDTLIFDQNIDEKLYPASLTKVMTCLLTLEMQTDLDQVVTVTAECLKGMEPDGSNIALKVDEQMSVRDLLYGLMVKSGNDAASTLAVHNSGSIEAFVEVMNRRAQELGCTGTKFMNPHGLHHDDHYTTARDMAKILKQAMSYPIFEEIFTTKEYVVPATNLSDARELKTTNFLIRSNGYPNVLDSRVLGGKTGNTSKAGRCLCTLAEKDGMRLLTVVLGAKATYSSDGYSFQRYGNFEETTALLNFAYQNYTNMQVLTPSQVAGQFPVSGGEHNAFGAISDTMSAAVPAGSDINTIRYEYTLTEPLTAPVEKDQQIGMVRVWLDNTCLAQQELRAASAVAVEKTPERDPEETQDDSEGLWNSILTGALVGVAVLFVLVMLLRARAAAKRRRRRRKNAARKTTRTAQRGRRSR